MNAFAEKIAARIKKENITPLSGWYFSARHWIFILSFIVSIILGSIALAMLLVAVVQNEFEDKALWDMLWIPIVWIIVFALFVGVSFYSIEHTKKAYKLAPWKWISINIVSSFVIGTGLYFVAMEFWEDHMMMFSGMRHEQELFWTRPEQGFLSGKFEIVGENIQIIDFTGKRWNIMFDTAIQKNHPLFMKKIKKGEQTLQMIPPHPVKLKGEMISGDTFLVKDIKPFTRGPLHQENLQFQPDAPRPPRLNISPLPL